MRPPPPHGAQSAPWGPRRNGATSAERVPTVRLVHGGVQYREYLNEEQRSQTRGPNAAAALGWRPPDAGTCGARDVSSDRVTAFDLCP